MTENITASAPASPFSEEELAELNAAFETKPAAEIVAWAVERFFPDVSVACSFGGAGGMALLDMALRVRSDVSVFYLDTDFLFKETYDTLRATIERYNLVPEQVRASLTPEEQARQYGEALWERDPDLCCELRKVIPQRQYLQAKRCWITALRRDQGSGRASTPIVAWNDKFGVLKVNPLAAWTEKDVWAYVTANNVPYNPLLDRGFRSLGCTHCTRPVSDGEDQRAGRWDGFDKTECGLHT